MIDEHGFDKDSVDIFDCDTDHLMNSDHFVQWIEGAVFGLRKKFGPSRRIPIVIDNATGHNELTDSTKPPKCSWRKIRFKLAFVNITLISILTSRKANFFS